MPRATPGQKALSVSPTRRIIPAAEFARIKTDVDIVAPNEAMSIRQLPSLHEQARQHGHEQGITEALREVAAVMNELRASRKDGQAWLERMVFALLRKILGNCDADELVTRVAVEAIDACDRNLEQFAVHVHPSVAATVTSRLEQTKISGIEVKVVCDDRLRETGCELHTPFGIVDAGVDTQLDALESVLSKGTTIKGHKK